MKLPFSMLAACTAVIAFPTSAQDAQPKPAAGETANEAKEEKKVCKRVSIGMGSRKTERVCLTAEEWRKSNHQ